MTRASDFDAIVNSGGAYRLFVDLTPTTPLVNSGDVGPWVPLPAGGRQGFVHVELGATGANGATVVADYCNNKNGPADLAEWTSSKLTGPNTGDGFITVAGACFMRLRRTDSNGSGNVTATVVWG